MNTKVRHQLDIALGSGTGLLWGLFLSGDHNQSALNVGLAIATIVFLAEMYLIFLKK